MEMENNQVGLNENLLSKIISTFLFLPFQILSLSTSKEGLYTLVDLTKLGGVQRISVETQSSFRPVLRNALR